VALLDSLRRLLSPAGRTEALPFGVTYGAPFDLDVIIGQIAGQSVAELYRTQPHLRTVVSFLARNIAQLPLHGFARVSDSDRRRVLDDPLVLSLRQPNPMTTQYELMTATVSDLKLYDAAFWMTVPDGTRPGGWHIAQIPPTWVSDVDGDTPWGPEFITVVSPQNGERVRLNRDQFVHFHGYSPGNPARGSSPVLALRDVLAEQVGAWAYRQQLWKRGGRVGAYLTRPPDAPGWSPEARTRFKREWNERWAGDRGSEAGGTPLLEDGMTLNRLGFSAREDEWADVAKLSLATVAGVYHVNPTMVGILDNANFSNVREFKRMLYSDTLGPDLAMIEDRLNTVLVPRIAADPDLYLEFNIGEKLQGSFEEQAALISTAVGRPWMTADEARARFNMPALGGDAEALVTPLNVLVGGQASPRDTGEQNLAAAPALGRKTAVTLTRAKADDPLTVTSGADPEHVRLAAETLRKFFDRQRASVLSDLGAGKPNGWNEGRWNSELAADLRVLAGAITADVGAEVLTGLGFEPDVYDTARTEAFLSALAESRAGAINSTTRDQLADTLADDGDPAHVFDVAAGARADLGGQTLATTLTAFATVEAAKHTGRPDVTKTWVVTSTDPRPECEAVGGETVGIDDQFSNGAKWPGDAVLGAAGVANCSCGIAVTIP